MNDIKKDDIDISITDTYKKKILKEIIQDLKDIFILEFYNYLVFILIIFFLIIVILFINILLLIKINKIKIRE